MPESTQPELNSTVSREWGTAAPMTSLRALQMRNVPTAATRPPRSVALFFAAHLEKRSVNSATNNSVTKHASRCTSMRFSVMLLFSVSCSQNDPENAMVFHAIQQPRPRYVKLGACRSMDVSASENRSAMFAVVLLCARWLCAAPFSSQIAISPRFLNGRHAAKPLAGRRRDAVAPPSCRCGLREQGTEVCSRWRFRFPEELT